LASRLARPHTSNYDLDSRLSAAIGNELADSVVNSESVDWFDECGSTMPCVIYECSADRTVKRVSTNSSELLGISPKMLIENRSLFEDRLFEADRAGLNSCFELLLPGKTACVNHRIVNERGLLVWVAHSLRKTLTSTGSLVRGCLIPIPSEIWSRNLDVAIVSEFIHKIGNHFQLINLLLGSLRRVGRGLAEVDQLQQSVDRTVEFTRSFANYSQGLSCWADIELDEVVSGTIKSYIASFAEKNVAFNNHLKGTLTGIVVSGDPYFLDLAFGSIFQNALDATGSGGAVNISANIRSIQSSGPTSVEIVVWDTGSGMDRDTLTHATVPFFTSRRERDGLGLSLATRIIELQGGTLRVSSEELRGTEIAIVLPIRGSSHGNNG